MADDLVGFVFGLLLELLGLLIECLSHAPEFLFELVADLAHAIRNRERQL